jgi:hypothetical protein
MAGLMDALKSKFGNPDLKKSPLAKLAPKEDDELEKKRKEWFERRKEANSNYYDKSYEKNMKGSK